MDCHAHERPLNDQSSLQRTIEVVALEALKPRPEADVHRRRVLRLQPGDLLKRFGQCRPRPREQQLAREQCTVKVALSQGGQGDNGHCQAKPGDLGQFVADSRPPLSPSEAYGVGPKIYRV